MADGRSGDLLKQDPRVRFNEDGHRYEYSSRRFGIVTPPSTTQVMQFTGFKTMNYDKWRASIMRNEGCNEATANQKMESHRSLRAHIGTTFHGLVRQHLDPAGYKHPATHEESETMLEVWKDAFLPRIKDLIAIELPIIHPLFFYAGTPDLVTVLSDGSGNVWLVDWKTQQQGKEKRRRDEWVVQLSAYAELLHVCYDLRVIGAVAVIVTANNLIEVPFNRADLDMGRSKFLSLLWQFHNKVCTIRMAEQLGESYDANFMALDNMRKYGLVPTI